MIVGIDASNIGSGGTIRHLVEILRRTEPASHGISRIIVWGSHPLLHQIEPRSWLHLVPERLLDNSSLAVRLLWRAIKLPWLAHTWCDVLFVPSGTYLGRFRPVVTLSQNVLPFDLAEMWRYRFSPRLAKFLGLRMYQTRTFQHAAGVLFLTEQARHQVEQTTGPLPGLVAVVPHGIVEEFRCPPRTQQPRATFSWQRPFRWLYTSAVDLYKHQWHVVEAVARLRQQGVPVALDLVGGAGYQPAAARLQQALTRYGSQSDAIRFHGAVATNDLVRFYHEVDGFVFASSCEAFGQTLLEAMAAGLPVVCSNRSVMPSLLGDAGVYVDPEQPADIARAMLAYMDDVALRERNAWMGFEQARAYSWQRCANETFGFIADVGRV